MLPTSAAFARARQPPAEPEGRKSGNDSSFVGFCDRWPAAPRDFFLAWRAAELRL